MKKLQVRFTQGPGSERPVGTLVLDNRQVFFEYDPGFLATGRSLSPFRLPFQPGLFRHADRAFGPLPGLFDDSLPDGWGRLLMDRHFRALGRAPGEVDPLERLAWLGTRTMGALTYHPATRLDPADEGFDLAELARQSQDVLEGTATEVLPRLLRAGGSPGGARPKVLVALEPSSDRLLSGEDDVPDGFEPWMVKFAARGEARDAGPVERAYSCMAATAGIEVPPSRLFDAGAAGRFFGAKRFDRDGNRRMHVHTFGNLVQADFRVPAMDYLDLMKVTRALTRNQQEVARAFRRMAFNVLAHNRDDHVKNVSFGLDFATGEWALSPAYDLVFADGPGGEHSMTVAGEGRSPRREHLLRVAREALLPEPAARGVLDEVAAAVANWRRFADDAGVSTDRRDEIAGRLPRVW